MTDSFYDQDPSVQVAALAELAARALPAFGLPDDTPLTLVTERENAVFRAETPRGAMAVRVHRAGYHADVELRSHAVWAEALASAGVVRTAVVVRTAEGDVVAHAGHPAVPETRQVTLLEWAPGVMLAESGRSEIDQFGQVGELMARLHDHAGRWTAPPGFAVLDWDADGLLGENPTWGRFWDAAALDADARALLVRFRAHARTALEQFGVGADRFGLVHGDFLPENLLLGDDGAITLLDFDDCGRGWHLFDAATALIMPAMGDDFDAVRDAFVAGYRSVRPLPDEHLGLLDLFLTLRAATYVGWMDTRSHTQFAKDMTPIVLDGAVAAVRELLDA